jgi:hypothetical protein
MPMRRVHAEHPSKALDFATSSNPSPTAALSTRIQTRAVHLCASRGSACRATVSPECGSSTPVAVPKNSATADVRQGQKVPLWTTGSTSPCQPRVQPRSRTLPGNKHGSSAHPDTRIRHPQPQRNLADCGGARLTLHRRGRQLQFPDGRPGPAPDGAKGVAVVTCPSSPGLEPE